MSAATLPPSPLPQPAPLVLGATRISVRGVVQGVGFRPFVHRLALRNRLTGWVRNASGDVQIHVAGAPDDVTVFIERLKTEAPPLAQIDELRVESSQSTAFRLS